MSSVPLDVLENLEDTSQGFVKTFGSSIVSSYAIVFASTIVKRSTVCSASEWNDCRAVCSVVPAKGPPTSRARITANSCNPNADPRDFWCQGFVASRYDGIPEMRRVAASAAHRFDGRPAGCVASRPSSDSPYPKSSCIWRLSSCVSRAREYRRRKRRTLQELARQRPSAR